MIQFIDNKYALAAYAIGTVVSILRLLFVAKKGERILPETWEPKYQRQLVWGLTFTAFGFIFLIIRSLTAPSPPLSRSCSYDHPIKIYLAEVNSLISSVSPKSSAWYKLKALNTFDKPDIPCEVKGELLKEARTSLEAVIKQYNL